MADSEPSSKKRRFSDDEDEGRETIVMSRREHKLLKKYKEHLINTVKIEIQIPRLNSVREEDDLEFTLIGSYAAREYVRRFLSNKVDQVKLNEEVLSTDSEDSAHLEVIDESDDGWEDAEPRPPLYEEPEAMDDEESPIVIYLSSDDEFISDPPNGSVEDDEAKNPAAHPNLPEGDKNDDQDDEAEVVGVILPNFPKRRKDEEGWRKDEEDDEAEIVGVVLANRDRRKRKKKQDDEAKTVASTSKLAEGDKNDELDDKAEEKTINSKIPEEDKNDELDDEAKTVASTSKLAEGDKNDELVKENEAANNFMDKMKIESKAE